MQTPQKGSLIQRKIDAAFIHKVVISVYVAALNKQLLQNLTAIKTAKIFPVSPSSFVLLINLVIEIKTHYTLYCNLQRSLQVIIMLDDNKETFSENQVHKLKKRLLYIKPIIVTHISIKSARLTQVLLHKAQTSFHTPQHVTHHITLPAQNVFTFPELS